MNAFKSEQKSFFKISKLNRIITYVVLLISAFNFFQWYFAKTYLIKFDLFYIPMAPLTSILFVLASASSILQNKKKNNKKINILVKAISIITLVICLMNILYNTLNFNIDLDKYFLPTEEILKEHPIGKMSPLTALIFGLISVFLFFYTKKLNKKTNSFLSILGIIILFSGFIFMLGYLHKAPLLYAYNIIPISFLASLNFLLLGFVFSSLVNYNFYPLNLLMKSRIGGQLAKAILPAIIIAIVLNGILTANVFLHFQNPTLFSALLIIIAIIIISIIIFRLSNSFGLAIETAERKLLRKNEQYSILNKKLKEKNNEYLALNKEYLTLNEELDKKVKMRTKELDEANQLLKDENENKQKVIETEKELNQLKSQFISIVSHEFRTPLAGIYSSIQILQKFGSNLDEKKKEELYERMYRTLHHTNLLIDDVSLIGKDDLGKIQIQPTTINIQAICKEVISDASSVFDYQIDINTQFKNTIPNGVTDERLFRHILSNLISNGIKYSDKKPIELFVENDANGYFQFTIKDNGIGIPEENLKYIFTPFNRADNVNNIEGTGLGLSITKRCIDLLKGEISIESEVGKGTTVIFKIPDLKK